MSFLLLETNDQILQEDNFPLVLDILESTSTPDNSGSNTSGGFGVGRRKHGAQL